MAHTTDIVGYTYSADLYCPSCIIAQLPTGEGGAFDGWALAPGVHMSAEDNLNEIAAAFCIDRHDEWSFDSGDFPKVAFRDMLNGDSDHCASCGEVLGE